MNGLPAGAEQVQAEATSAMGAAATVQSRKVPGAAAPTVDVDVLWNSMTRWLLKSPSTSLRFFVHSSFSRQDNIAQSSCTPRPVWPIPLPYWGKSYSAEKRERSFQQALNMMVVVLNWLQLGQPRRVPRDCNPYAVLTFEQKKILQRLRHLAKEWQNSPPITAEDMGRSAGKFEQLEDSLNLLTRRAVALMKETGSGVCRAPKTSERPNQSGSLLADVSAAKEVESHRLQFKGTPSFDPTRLLSEETRQVYVDPLTHSMDPADALQDPPHVQVRGKRSEVLGLFRKLDQTQRLALFTKDQVRWHHRAGLFTLMKDLAKDRLIMDARPANQLECGLTQWTNTMGSITPLLGLFVPPGQVVACCGEDLQDYYYHFQVTSSRAIRNSIKYELSLQEAKTLTAYASTTPDQQSYIPALRTMAMGDINAVEVGQESHVKLALTAGVCLKDLLTMRGRLPRFGPYIGIVIDDFITLECVPRPLTCKTEAAAVADKMVDIYAAAGLVAHDGKRFRDTLHSKFWGASLDGEAGTIRFQLEKLIPLAMLTAQIARLGWANRKLLEVVSGAWVAALQCRRRCMCLLDFLFDEIQHFDYDVNFPLSGSAVDELWTLVICCPWFVTDLRAEHCTEFALVDASNEWEAEVTTQVSPVLAEELGRQRLTKAAWSRLLSPLQAIKKQHGTLSPSEEVPPGEKAACEHPLWSGVVKSKQFKLQWRRRVRHRPHINVSEMAAALRSEARRARRFPGSRILTGSDSQVVLGALVKGRSSSKVLNRQLKRSLPTVLAYNVYNYTQYIHTLLNVADDPTRDRDCRPPDGPPPDWLTAVEEQDYAGLDELLRYKSLDDCSVARLPMQHADAVPTGDSSLPSGASGPLTSPTSFSPRQSQSPMQPMTSSTSSSPTTTLPSAPLSTPGKPLTSAMSKSPSTSLTPKQPPTTLQSLPRPTSAAPATLQHPRRLLTRAFRTAETKSSRKPPVASLVRSEPWLPRRKLSAAAQSLLEAIPADQFVLPRGAVLQELLTKPGHLDLFSGCRIAAQELANRSGRWVLTYDVLHSPSEDLLDTTIQEQIHAMVDAECFLSVTAGPVCSSFSRAVRPPVRTSNEPAGIQTMTPAMRLKVDIGNRMSVWLAALVQRIIPLNIVFWVENPSGSFLWLQSEWQHLIAQHDLSYFLTDYCRWNCPWRKRTRFLGRFSAAGLRCLCWCKQPHVRLVGYSKEHKCCWTKAAEGYPRSLAKFLAAAVTESLKPIGRQRHIDPGSMARCGKGRIGEASNPGPRQRRPVAGADLEQVELVKPATLALQARVHRLFLDWLQGELTEASWGNIVSHPHLQVIFLRSFGNWLFTEGRPMYLFRHLVVFLQQQYPAVRHQVLPAWDLLARWEVLQPVSHRPPLPKMVLDAMCCLALSWGWYRWTTITLLAYHGACRVGEPLKALRKDLLLPDEAGLSMRVCFLNISAPKPGRRGRGRQQHTKITDLHTVQLAEEFLQDLPVEGALYPSSLSSYRRRWDRILSELEIPVAAALTPGCLRGGGAVWLYHQGTPVSDIQWVMRLRHQQTLEHYLQETAAIGVLHMLPTGSKEKVRSCAAMFPYVHRSLIS